MPQLTTLFQTLPYGPAPESADAADAWLDSHGRKFDLFINNNWVAPAEGKTLYLSPTQPAARPWRKPPMPPPPISTPLSPPLAPPTNPGRR